MSVKGYFVIIKVLLISLFICSTAYYFYPQTASASIYSQASTSIYKYFLPICSASVLLFLTFLYRAVKNEQIAAEKVYKKNIAASSSFFRHEIMNQLQILYCLCQLGKKERLERSINSLSEKLRCYGQASRFAPPDLASSLGSFIFAAPAETSLTIDIPSSIYIDSSAKEEAEKVIGSLQGFIQGLNPKRIVLKIYCMEDVEILEVDMALNPSDYTPGGLRKFLMESGFTMVEGLQIREDKPAEEFSINISLPLRKHSSLLEKNLKELPVKIPTLKHT